jgi:plastocyanin
MRKLFGALVLAGAMSVVVAGCGSSESGGSGSEPASGPASELPSNLSGPTSNHGTAKVEDGKVEVELDDDYFGPTVIEAKAGEKVTLELKNEGTKEHNFTLEAADVDEDLEPGDTKTVTVTVPDQSDAGWYCEYHQDGGMQGSFLVS